MAFGISGILSLLLAQTISNAMGRKGLETIKGAKRQTSPYWGSKVKDWHLHYSQKVATRPTKGTKNTKPFCLLPSKDRKK